MPYRSISRDPLANANVNKNINPVVHNMGGGKSYFPTLHDCKLTENLDSSGYFNYHRGCSKVSLGANVHTY